MTDALYRCWILPVIRIRNALVLETCKRNFKKRTHTRRVPTQYPINYRGGS